MWVPYSAAGKAEVAEAFGRIHPIGKANQVGYSIHLRTPMVSGIQQQGLARSLGFFTTLPCPSLFPILGVC
jgi:hypothetical protein